MLCLNPQRIVMVAIHNHGQRYGIDRTMSLVSYVLSVEVGSSRKISFHPSIMYEVQSTKWFGDRNRSGIFGVSSHECLNYTATSRDERTRDGVQIMQEYLTKYLIKSGCLCGDGSAEKNWYIMENLSYL